MKRSEIVAELRRRGYEAREEDVVKNSVICEGIVIKDNEQICPCIYTEQLLKNAEEHHLGLDEVVDRVITWYEEDLKKVPFRIEDITDIEWIKAHLQIGLQKSSNEDLIKKDVEGFEGIEAYLFVSDLKSDTGISFKLHPEHLDMYRVFEAEIWEIAYEHLCKDTQIMSMSEIIAEMLGTPDMVNEDDLMYVISNHTRTKGASAILNKDVLKEFCEKQHVKRVFVLPSSIHECILVPDQGDFTVEELSLMVTEVNTSEVDPVEQLPNRAYVVEF